jgi:hypothetical protein
MILARAINRLGLKSAAVAKKSKTEYMEVE